MAIQPIFDEFKFSTEKMITKQTQIECRVNSAIEIKKIIAIKGCAYSIGEEIVESEINFSGRAFFYVVFETIDGDIVKSESGVEFADKTDKQLADSIKFISYSVSEEEIRFVNGVYTITANVNANIFISTEKTVSCLVGGDGLLCDKTDFNLDFVIGSNKSILQVDEEFDVDFLIKDVLIQNYFIHISEVQSSIGSIILDGNIFLTLTMLQNEQKNGIVKESKKIPFRLELDLPEASPAMKAYALTDIAKSSVKVVVDEGLNKSTIIVGIDINTYGCVYDRKPISLVKDVYSASNDVSVAISDINNMAMSAQYCITEKIMGTSDVKIESDCDVICAFGERIESLVFNTDNSALNGIVSVNLLVKNEGGEYFGKKAFLPFEISFNGIKSCSYLFNSSLESFSYRVRDYVELEIVVKISVIETECNVCHSVTDLTIGAEKVENKNAISIYIPRGNDTLWDVCKELGVSAERIMELNPDVEFPLSCEDRIIVYRNI